MSCVQLSDQHLCALALVKSGKPEAVFNPTAAALFRDMATLKLVKWDESMRPIHPATKMLGYGRATIMPDGVSTLDDYRELGADV